MKNALKITFALFLAVSFSSCENNNDIEEFDITITLNDGTSTGFDVSKGYLTVFNPSDSQNPATFLIIIPDSTSDITTDGSNNIVGSGKNLKIFMTSPSASTGDSPQFITYTLGQPSTGGLNYLSYENGEAIESATIVDGFAGTITIANNSINISMADITIDATDPNNPQASIKGTFSVNEESFTY